jgi:hypothetical protein
VSDASFTITQILINGKSCSLATPLAAGTGLVIPLGLIELCGQTVTIRAKVTCNGEETITNAVVLTIEGVEPDEPDEPGGVV